MKSLIPHKNNHNAKGRILGVLIIISFSATIAYFGGNYIKKYSGKASAVGVGEIKNINTEVPAEGQVNSDLKQESNQVKINEKEIPVTQIEDNATLATTIEEAKSPVSIVRDKDPKKRLEEALIYAKPQITDGKYIDVSLSHQNMVLFEDGKIIDAYLISSGKKGMETPQGTFRIQNKVPRAWSKSYGLFMPNWMALVSSGKYGIHELPEWPGGYKEGANHLGVAVSHGCVRLGTGAAKRVYDWAEIGTAVIIHK